MLTLLFDWETEGFTLCKCVGLLWMDPSSSFHVFRSEHSQMAKLWNYYRKISSKNSIMTITLSSSVSKVIFCFLLSRMTSNCWLILAILGCLKDHYVTFLGILLSQLHFWLLYYELILYKLAYWSTEAPTAHQPWKEQQVFIISIICGNLPLCTL